MAESCAAGDVGTGVDPVVSGQSPSSSRRTSRSPSVINEPVRSEGVRGPKISKPRLLYRREYLDREGGVVYAEDLGSQGIKAEESPYAVVITETFGTNQDRDTYRPDSETNLPPTVEEKLATDIEVKSQAVIHALRSIIGYYPRLSLNSDTVRFSEPFLPLYYHLQELQEYHDHFANASARHELCQEDRNVAGDIKLLLEAFEDACGRKVRDELERHRKPRPTCTYKMLWMLFKPGIDVYVDELHQKLFNGAVVKEMRFESVDGNYRLFTWHLRSNHRNVGPSPSFDYFFVPFTGEKEIADLAIFPCSFMREDKHGITHEQRYKDLAMRGQKYFSLLRGPQFLSFDGHDAQQSRTTYRGRTMIDFVQYRSDGVDILLVGDLEAPNVITPRCECPSCKEFSALWSRRRTHFSDYSVLNPFKVDELTEHQNFLCSRSIPAYFLKHREWMHLEVEGFSRPQYKSNLMDTLVLPSSTRQLLQCLCQKFTSGATWSADFIEGKGEGSIVLLHGKPGVGKTYTAECVAEETKKPLISLTSADIGTDPTTVEEKLLYWFKLAKAWGAILLLDEADVFLERRSATDLVRNNLVAIFLRTLEYYQGILFLTTNRIGTFDEAFISRIDVPLYFPALTNEQRTKIWQTFFRKLEDERQDKIRVAGDLKYYIEEDRDLLALEWNGREIRSGFQTAVALAEIEGLGKDETMITVKKKHITTVVEMSKEFKRYLKDLHQQSADDLAASMRLRYDPSLGESKGSGSGNLY